MKMLLQKKLSLRQFVQNCCDEHTKRQKGEPFLQQDREKKEKGENITRNSVAKPKGEDDDHTFEESQHLQKEKGEEKEEVQETNKAAETNQ